MGATPGSPSSEPAVFWEAGWKPPSFIPLVFGRGEIFIFQVRLPAFFFKWWLTSRGKRKCSSGVFLEDLEVWSFCNLRVELGKVPKKNIRWRPMKCWTPFSYLARWWFLKTFWIVWFNHQLDRIYFSFSFGPMFQKLRLDITESHSNWSLNFT